MRNSHVCPKCRHNHILLIDRVPDSAEVLTDQRVATVLEERYTWWSKTLVRDRLASAGTLQAAICKSCGYTEFYTQAPADLFVDGELVREVVGPEAVGPFR